MRQLEVAERFDADPGKRRRHVSVARDLARESLAEARRSVQALRPGPLAAAQLPEALAELAAAWSARQRRSPPRLEVSGEAVALPPGHRGSAVPRRPGGACQRGQVREANRVGVTLSYTSDVVVLDVVRRRQGLRPGRAAPSTDGTGYGLSAMRTRLTQIGGTPGRSRANPATGTAISAAIPLPTTVSPAVPGGAM